MAKRTGFGKIQLRAPAQYQSSQWKAVSDGVITNNPYYSGYDTGTPVASPSSGRDLIEGTASTPVFSSSGGQSALNSSMQASFDNLLAELKKIQASNNAWSAEQAQKQMDFQSASADKAMAFNADQAKLSRAWQEYMSNSAHQREIKDLKASGLNPVLSAMGGSGAPVTSGATASGYVSSGSKAEADTSLGPAMVSLFGSLLSAQTQLMGQMVSAQSASAVADKYTAMTKYTSELGAQTSLTTANIAAAASRYVAQTHAGATISSAQLSSEAAKVSASIHAAAQKYGYDLNSMTQKEIASFNAEVNKQLQANNLQHDFDIRSAYPSSFTGLISSIFDNTLGTNFDDSNGMSVIGKLWSSLFGGSSASSIFGGGSYGGGGGRK